MKRIACLAVLIFSLLSLSSSPCWSEKSELQETVDHLESALNQHDFDILRPYLARNFSFSGYEGEMAISIMRQVVDQYPRTIQSITIQNVEDVGHQVRATLEIDLGEEIEQKELLLTDDFRILQAPIVEIMVAGHSGDHPGERAVQAASRVEFPPRMEMAFELVGKLIVVRAEVEGVQGNFIVDTGATEFVLHSKRFGILEGRTRPAPVTAGVNGPIGDLRLVTASGFRWQEIELDQVEAMYLDLSHLEESIGLDLVGIIGSDFLRQFTVQFDYRRHFLTLYTGDPTANWDREPSRTIDLETVGHIPVFEATIDDYSLQFGIDCGAETGMIFKRWEERLQEHYKSLGLETLSGADQESRKTRKVELSEFKVNGISFKNQDFMLADPEFGHEPILDGLVGYEFLSSNRTAINFQDQKLYIWDL